MHLSTSTKVLRPIPGYQCHRCGSTQHFIRDCPFKGRGASREARGTEREAASNVRNLSFSSEGPDTTEENNSGRGLAVKPGPRVTTTVEVNGVECAAVVDTGSPVTVVSEECLLKVWKIMKPDLTNEERQEDIISNCRPATVTLRMYTDARVPNVAEIEVELKNRLKVMKTVVIVQKDAPQELLLGTDTLRSLGFSMELKELPENCEQGDGQEAVIRLIKATRVPARHAMLVEGDVGKAGNSGAPVPVVIKGECPADGLFVEPILVEAENGRTMVCLRNEGMAPVTLEEGTELGRAEEAIVVPEEEVSLDDVNVLSFSVDGEQRLKKLVGLLHCAETPIAFEQKDQMVEVLSDFADVFALSEEELGTTNVVQHSVDTGDSAPLKRRVPYSMRGKVIELVNTMLERGIIEPSSSPWASPIVLVSKRNGTSGFAWTIVD